jgi:hypothetical protein
MATRAPLNLFLIAAMIWAPAASAQFSPTLPAQSTGGVFVGSSTPAQQQLFNFVAFPVGTVNTPTGTQQLEYRFTLPVVFTNPNVPTDLTPVPNWQQRIRDRVLGPDRNYVPEPTPGLLVQRDPRYSFNGHWLPIIEGQTQVAMAPGANTFYRVIPRVSQATTGDTSVPHVMQTADASYALTAANEVTLTQGALLVKGGRTPFHILMPMKNDTAVVQIEQGTFAMVSNLDGRVTVANLADTHNTGCMTMLTDRPNKTYGEMPVRIGYMIEIYPNESPAAENRIASYSTLRQLRLANGLSVETMRVNYPYAFKRFNLTRALPDADFRRLVKTAAAVAYLDRGDVL